MTDDDVRRLIDYEGSVAAMERALQQLAAGTLIAPPRVSLDTEFGSLVLTMGATSGIAPTLGFRAYDTVAGASTDTPQIVATFDPVRGGLTGIIIGSLIGAMRTGSLGGVALKHLAPPGARVLAVIGAGFQAQSQLQAALAVCKVDRVVVTSRTVASAQRFQRWIFENLNVDCEVAESPRIAVREADIIICATSSREPVIKADWVKPGSHLTTVGPKFRGAQELPSNIADRCSLITTDSVDQVNSYDSFFLDVGNSLVGLEQIVAGNSFGRTDPSETTLYCSVGLAGTEVVLADEVLRRARSAESRLEHDHAEDTSPSP